MRRCVERGIAEDPKSLHRSFRKGYISCENPESWSVHFCTSINTGSFVQNFPVPPHRSHDIFHDLCLVLLSVRKRPNDHHQHPSVHELRCPTPPMW